MPPDSADNVVDELDRDAQYAKALGAAARWAKGRPLPPRRFGQVISDVETNTTWYGRLYTCYERREPVWRENPYRGRQQVRPPELVLDAVRPWDQTEQEIDRLSRHVAICDTCDGEKTVECPTCRGSGRVSCPGCLGTGTNFGRGKKLFVRCRSCRGASTQKCGRCSNGRVDCPRCDRSGRLERWIEIRYATNRVVTPMPNAHVCSSHPDFMTPTPTVAPWSSSTTHAHTEVAGQIQEVALTSLAPDIEWLELKRGAESMLDQNWDRIVHQAFQSFSAPASKVTFDFSGRRGYVLLVGHEPEPTTDFDDTPFRNRRRWVAAAGLTSLLLSIAATILYARQDTFYSGTPSWVLLGSLLFFGAGITLAIGGWRRRISSQGTSNPAALPDRIGQGIGAAGLAGALAVLAFVHPSATTALESIDAGDLATAEEHLRALANTGEQAVEVDLAATKLALAKANDLDNRAAVRTLSEALQQVRDGSAIAAQLERLRREWIAQTITDGRVDEADAEIAALRSEVPQATDLSELSTKALERRIDIASEQLSKGEHAAALFLLAAAPQDHPRIRELAVAVHTGQANACPDKQLACIVSALRAAAQLAPDGPASLRLAELRVQEIASANALVLTKGTLEEKFLSRELAVQRLERALELFGKGAEIDDALNRQRTAVIDLLKGVFVLGSSPTIAKHLLVKAGAAVVAGDSVITATRFPGADGVTVYLPIQHDQKGMAAKVLGAHIAYAVHATRALEPDVVNAVARVLLGMELPARSLKGPSKGIKHTVATLARQRISLGWHDGGLVEVIIGRVDP